MYLRWCVIILFIVINTTLKADQFSLIAEARNILDPAQLSLYLPHAYPVELKIFGYVKAEGIFDTRQNLTFRDGQVLYFPLNKMPDKNGRDINARGDFDAYAIQTTIDFKGRGPNIGCAESGFLIEGNFLGRTDSVIDSFNLWLGYLEIKTDEVAFLAGQTFHPLCFPDDFPATISFNQGIPIVPFALCPQIRFTCSNDHWEIWGAAIGFLGDRPFGPTDAGDIAFRESIMPDFNFLGRFKFDDDNYIGADFDIMRITPRLVSNNNYKEVNPFTAISADVFSRFQCGNFIWYTKALYVEDAQIFEMIGGFAVHSIDLVTDLRTYVPLRTIAIATEVIWKDVYGMFEPAIFAGYVKNIGAKETIIPNFGPDDESGIFSLGPDISNVLRVSPRIRCIFKSLVLGAELEYTRAAYGIITNHGNVEDTIPVGNLRFLFATYYMF